VQRLAAEGATAFVEVGPGRVLSGLARRIVEDATIAAVEDPAGLDKALAALKAP
jgi:[acyl-carrier-protein] S-malonyltransferase